MNYHLNGNGNVVTAGFFYAYAACPLNKTTDWRMNKFTRDFMVEFFFKVWHSYVLGEGQIQTLLLPLPH